jgi:hypothetical protein
LNRKSIQFKSKEEIEKNKRNQESQDLRDLNVPKRNDEKKKLNIFAE